MSQKSSWLALVGAPRAALALRSLLSVSAVSGKLRIPSVWLSFPEAFGVSDLTRTC